ncbi:hypothetical protein [Jidongwangia harbinensis]|uniref:hypothetical protein n=1 Tax=Jidongwangia harbinensis TaxID=2878561 RepID=UPI001CD91D98|nr:hypothetical protein [Jidongwangia harbinensis]MCA2218382.1 hypothetical protein [Jidongwangia harbinensis]
MSTATNAVCPAVGRRRAARCLVLLVVLLATIAVRAAPAAASWATQAAWQSGTVGMARAQYTLSGSDAAAFTTSFSLVEALTVEYFTITNTGSTAATFTGAVTHSAGAGPLQLSVWSCPTAFTVLGSCPGGATVLVAGAAMGNRPPINFGGTAAANATLAAGTSRFLKVHVNSLLVGGWAKIGMGSAVLPAGGRNRTQG